MLIRLIPICAIALLQTGCAVGAIWAFNTDRKYFDPNFANALDVNELPYESVQPKRTDTRTEKIWSKEEVLNVLGKPKRVHKDEGREIWIYSYDLAWRGIVPIALFPIPFMVPVGMNEKGFEFQDDRLVGAWKEVGSLGGGYCVIFGISQIGPVYVCKDAKTGN